MTDTLTYWRERAERAEAEAKQLRKLLLVTIELDSLLLKSYT